MKIDELVAIDIHTHAETSTRLADLAKIDIRAEVRPLILKDNAARLLGLMAATKDDQA